LLAVLLGSLLVTGQSAAKPANQTIKTSKTKAQGGFGILLPRVSNRPANVKGRVMVIMYHHIANGKGPMFRNPTQFRGDLERLYKMGFRPVTMTEYIENRMPLGKGASPVIMTFDDAHPNQFKYKSDGTVDPNCAVGIWTSFAKKHPDFPVKATWYVLPVMWGQKSLIQKKVDFLIAQGGEIGNHTYHHKDLRKLSTEAIKSEIGSMYNFLRKYNVPANMPFCPPYGSYPKARELFKSFKYKGGTVSHNSACWAGSMPAVSPNDPKKLRKYDVARVHGNGAGLGVSDWLNKLQSKQWTAYVAP
jgi:peptidoglycan/xylan/chitin deacetylase (PgdA/CDA1 family)